MRTEHLTSPDNVMESRHRHPKSHNSTMGGIWKSRQSDTHSNTNSRERFEFNQLRSFSSRCLTLIFLTPHFPVFSWFKRDPMVQGQTRELPTGVSPLWNQAVKGEVRTINDRNICERRSCMKNNGKSPAFKIVSGEESRPSEVQRVSRGWRLPGATHSSADPTWIRKWLGIQAPELSELKSVEIELGSCCFDLDNKVSDEICWTRKKQFEIPFRL